MKKIQYILIITILFQSIGFAQNDSIPLKFDTEYFNAVDKWVVFPKSEKDSLYSVGYIYIDQMAGYTYKYDNTFTIKNQKLIPSKKDSIITYLIIKRLGVNTKLVAVLTDSQNKQLENKKHPEGQEIYKHDEKPVALLKQIGYQYNHVGNSKKALEPLLKAYKIEPHFKGLEFELAYAYNALGKFDKAIPILEKAIDYNDNDHLLYKELGFALINSKQIEKAEEVFLRGINISKNNAIKCEMALNMSHAFYQLKNRNKFDKWAILVRKFGDKTPQYIKYIESFEKDWDKKTN